jgi:hypothetical protein
LAGAGLISYLVQPFDTLASIAKAHSTTPEAIRSLNGIDFIRLGDTILVPIRESRVAGSATRSR